MSYKTLPQIPRAERTYWSPERGGRVWQTMAGTRVRKFSYSPFTAKAREEYTFYADVEMEKEIESPPGSGAKRKFWTIPINTGTYLDFRNMVLSGEAEERVREIAEVSGGGDIVSLGYWRNRGVHQVSDE